MRQTKTWKTETEMQTARRQTETNRAINPEPPNRFASDDISTCHFCKSLLMCSKPAQKKNDSKGRQAMLAKPKISDGDAENGQKHHSNGPTKQDKSIVIHEPCDVHSCSSGCSDMVHKFSGEGDDVVSGNSSRGPVIFSNC